MNRSIFQIWNPKKLNSNKTEKQIKNMNLNFGPQHPAAHGVLRLILQLNGEIIEKTDPHIGLLHRGTEKLIEQKPYLHSIPYFDRFDYVSMLVQEHAYCLAIESLLNNKNYSSIFSKIRVLFDELTRILNHFLAIGCHALDVGSMSSLFWAFEEREKIMEFYERVSGARMHAAFYRPNNLNLKFINKLLLNDILEFIKNCLTTLNEMHNILTFNKIWKQRLVNIGILNISTCLNYGLSGVLTRSVGLKRDLRLSRFDTYSNYYFLDFKSFIGQKGDSYDRYLIRMGEMVESLNIINQIVKKLLKNNYKNFSYTGDINIYDYIQKKKNFSKNNMYNNMENLINHFKFWSEGEKIKNNITNQSVESPKGEFSVFLISDNTNKPNRCKVRSPGYFSLQALPKLAKGHFLADLVTLIGTIDIVFGEIDR